MMIQENINLKPYHTFGIDVYSKYFATFQSIEGLQEMLQQKITKENKNLILGGGSNILFTKNFDGILLKNEIDFIEVIKETDEYVYVRCGAGTNWHQFVLYCIKHNWAGVENLSLIPGCIGASPMQNIGAYGVEVKDVIETVETIAVKDYSNIVLTNKDCAFGYRESIFKQELKGEYIITAVTFKLNKTPTYHTSYGAILTELEKMKISNLSIQAISNAIINIRSSKLPDPKVLGNAGSFFKNPTITKLQFEILKKEFEGIVGYYNEKNQTVKIAAGWLIEHCGYKGFRKGDAGCNALQALVLVNYGNATGNQMYDLSCEIISSVHNKFKINLEREVNII
jgi:UDP-N-acetylmuramate dehydrogenase